MKLSVILAGISALAVSAPASACTTTQRRLAQLDLSPTTTVYATTKTAVSELNCGGCISLIIWEFGGSGPVRPEPRATIYRLRLTTTTTFVCSTAPKPYAPAS